MNYRRFRWNQPELVSTSGNNQKVACETECGDVMFVNQSNADGSAGVIYMVHNMPLPAGASITFGCNSGEITTGAIYAQGPQPNGVYGLYIFRKKYID